MTGTETAPAGQLAAAVAALDHLRTAAEDLAKASKEMHAAQAKWLGAAAAVFAEKSDEWRDLAQGWRDGLDQLHDTLTAHQPAAADNADTPAAMAD